MKQLPIAVILSAVAAISAAPVSTQDFDKGLAAARAGDYATALAEWTPLAEQGYAQAQYNLGVSYGRGEGVPQDFVTAHMWANISAANGAERGPESRAFIETKMTSAYISEAQRRARICMS